jgi:hypothetical protein
MLFIVRVGVADKSVFGRSVALSHLIQAEFTYVDPIQMCFFMLCLVARMSRAELS